MEITPKNVKITASSDETCWGGSFSENGLFLLLEVEGFQNLPAPEKGNEILDLLLTKITNYQERNRAILTELVNWAKEIKFIHTLTLGFLKEDVLYLANIGTGEVLLKRGQKLGKILSSGEIAAGKVMPGDILFFSSKTFINCIDTDKQKELLQRENITDIAEDAYSLLVSNNSSIGAAAVIFKLEEQIISTFEGKSDDTSQKKDHKTIINQKWQNITSFFHQKKEDLWEEGEDSKSKRTLLTIAIILIFLLIASIFLNINHSQSTNKENRLKQTLELVSHQYDEAISLIDLNPSRARILLSDGKISLSGILKDFPKNSKEYKQVSDWLSKIAEKEVDAYKIFKFTTAPLFFDINLIKNGGAGNKISLDKETSVILDSKNKTVYSLFLDTKKASIIAGSETVKDTRLLTVHGKSAYVLNSDGIVGIDITTKTVQSVVKQDKEWGEIGELVSFGGNLYLLDKKNNAIWKYIALETGFSTKGSYLNPGIQVSFTNAGKMLIDGSVWVLADPASILKFTNGHSDAFAFKGLSDTLSDISNIFTSDEAKNLYILQKNSQRILVFDKEGNYQSQYQWDELKNADDLVVSEADKKIFVLSASKIYAIDLKQ